MLDSHQNKVRIYEFYLKWPFSFPKAPLMLLFFGNKTLKMGRKWQLNHIESHKTVLKHIMEIDKQWE